MSGLRRLLPRSAYELMAAVAFFMALAGAGAYAAGKIGPNDIKDNAVRSRHIRDGEVNARDLAASSVGTGKVIDGSLTRESINGQVLPFPPVAFDQHVANAHTQSPPVTDVQLVCTGPGSGPHVAIQFLAPSAGQHVYLLGTQAVDEQPPTPAPRDAGSVYTLETTGTAVYLDAMVQYNPGGFWSHFQIRGIWTADGCDFGGIYTPPTV